MSKTILLYGGVFIAALSLVVSIASVIDVRYEVNALTNEYHQVREKGHALRDTQRNLQIEYYTKIDYNNIHRHALKLGMREPSLADKSLIYLPTRKPQ